MHIWIFNHYAQAPDATGGTRHYDLSMELIKRGFSVRIFASSFNYVTRKETKRYSGADHIAENIDGIDFVWIKTPPYNCNNWKRVLNMALYSWRAFKAALALKKGAPDVVLGSSVHLFAVLCAYLVAKRFKKPFIMEVRDLWPLTLIELGVSRWNPLVILLSFLERFLYRKAAKIITVMPKGKEYISSLGIDPGKVIWISNGVNMERFKAVLEPPALPTVAEFMAMDGAFKVVYTGDIGAANNIRLCIDAAKELREYENIRFVFIGDGPKRAEMERAVRELRLKNVIFLPPVPKKAIPYILTRSDALLLSFVDAKLYKYGQSPNKLFDYMAAGKPVIFCSTASNNPVLESGGGISVTEISKENLAKAVLALYNMPKDRRDLMGIKGKDYVERHYSMPVLADKLENVIRSVL